MKESRGLSMRAKLAVAFLLSTALVTIALLLTFQQFGKALQAEQTQSERYDSAYMDVVRLKDKMATQRSDTLAMLSVTGARREAMIAKIHHRSGEIDGVLEQFERRAPHDSEVQVRLKQLVSLRDAVRKTREQQIIPFLRQGKTAQAKALLLGVQQQRADRLQSLLGQIAKKSHMQYQEELSDVSSTTEAMWRSTTIIIVTVLIVAFLLSVVIAETYCRNCLPQRETPMQHG